MPSFRERARALKIQIPALLIALGKYETPLAAKLIAALAVAYALSPVDLIPDFIPVLGYLDDLIILPALVSLAIRLIPEPVMQSCLRESEGLWQDGAPKRWYYAIPMIVVWALVLWGLASLIIRAGRS